MRAQQLVLQALSVAVPLSNRGDYAGCSEIYATAAAKILADGQPEPPMREMLQAALSDALRTPDATQRAWQLRRTLDAVVNDESGSAFFNAGGLPLDFSDQNVAAAFVAVDDRIMGGASTSRVRRVGGAASFEGELIVEGGGFASVRYVPPLRLPADTDALRLEARGDGRSGYKLTLRSAATDSSVSYQYTLPPLDGPEFSLLRLPLSAFRASSRGRPWPDAPALVAGDVRSLGFMLSRYDAGGGERAAISSGRFQLEIRRLLVAESELAVNSRRWVQKPR